MGGVLAFFNIRAGEGRPVALMILHAFLLGITIHFTQTAAFALFLTQFEAQTLPFVYILNAVAITALISAYLKLSRYLSFASLLLFNLVTLLILTVLLYLGVSLSGAAWLFFALPTLFELTVSLGNLEYFSLAGRLFDLRQSKRLLGTIYGGQWAAVVICGLFTPLLVTRMGTVHLFLLSIGALVANLALLAYLTRLFKSQLADLPVAAAAGQSEGKTGWQGSRYIYLIFALVSLWWLVYFFVDNIFFARAAAQYLVEAELASFLGLFYASVGIVALLTSIVLSGPILSRYGLQKTLLLLPASLTLGSILMIIFGPWPSLFSLLFWVTALSKLLDMALGFSLDRTALNILYQPLPAQWRNQIKATAEGIFQPLAIGLAGLALLVLLRVLGVGPAGLTYILLGLCLAWLGVAFLIGREYPKMLLAALTQRRLSGSDLNLSDESSLAVLRQALKNPHPKVALYALHTLAQNDPQALPELLSPLLSHPAPEVRQEALSYIQHLSLTPALEAVKNCLQTDQSPIVQVVALRTLVALSPVEGLEQVYPYLQHSDPQLRLASVASLLRYGGVEVTMVAERELLQWTTSTDPAERIQAAQVIGEVKSRNLSSLLESLLQDEDLDVRRAALLGAGQAGYPQLWPRVIANLAQRQLRSVAGVSLAAGGENSLAAIRVALQAEPPHEILIRLLRVCSRIESEGATVLLLSYLASPDDRVRSQVVTALERRSYQAAPSERASLQQRIEAEISFATVLLDDMVGLVEGIALAGNPTASRNGPQSALGLLQQALSQQFQNTQDRLLLLLSFIYDRQAFLQARANLKLDSPEKRAYALEIIDLSLPGSLKPQLFPLLEELGPAQRLERLRRTLPEAGLAFEQRLAGLAQAPNAWVSACALYLAGNLGHSAPLLLEVATTASHAKEPVVAETARLTLVRLTPQTEL